MGTVIVLQARKNRRTKTAAKFKVCERPDTGKPWWTRGDSNPDLLVASDVNSDLRRGIAIT
jgi:hypothetical protein